jgi:methoxymalonate biosynthesis acyl carrier protein
MSTPADEIRGFIQQRHPSVTLGDDEDIFALGFINSLFAMELVMFIEQRFAFQLPTEDIKIANFATVTAMERLVARHSAAVTTG